MTQSDRYTFDEASKLNDKFELLLKKHGIEIKRGSALEAVALSVEDVRAKYMSPNAKDANVDIRKLFREATGATGLAHRVLRVESHPDFGQLIKHLKLLERTMPNQNLATPITDGDNNKVFELLVATAAMVHGTDIQLDDPDASSGGLNPDVMATIQGTRWAFACKAAHTQNGKTIKESIEGGVAQIDRSSAVKGLVLVNVKNIVDHSQFWQLLNEVEWKKGAEPDFYAFKDTPTLAQKLDSVLLEIAQRIEADERGKSLLSTLSSSKSIPAYGLCLSVTTGVVQDGHPTATIVHALKLFVPGTGKGIPIGDIALFGDGLQHSPRFC